MKMREENEVFRYVTMAYVLLVIIFIQWRLQLVGKPEEKRSFGRPRSRWEDNIKIHLKEQDNESSGSVKAVKFLHQVRNYQPLKEDYFM
jgi:hypothetical protein